MRPLPRKSGVRISIRVPGARARIAAMQSTKCWAPPSRRSSRSTLVTTTYLSPMSATVLPRFTGSDASGGLGRPWATSQNEQRRVQTSPRIMKVAVPWPKHSWMFGQLASSHTVTSRFSRSFALRLATALPDGIRTRIHDGLRSTGASANCTGERPILSPPSCLAPASSGAAGAAVSDRTWSGIVRGAGVFMAAIVERGRPPCPAARVPPLQRWPWPVERPLAVAGQAIARGRPCAASSARPNWRATCSSSTGLTASIEAGPPRSRREVTCSPW